MSDPEQLERIARQVIDLGFEIHSELGPGLLESAYEALLEAGLQYYGHKVDRQIRLPMSFRGVVVDNAYKIDLMVDDCFIIEVKSIERLAAVHGKQLLTYLRLADMKLGLLVNFGQATFKGAFRRVANDYYGPFG